MATPPPEASVNTCILYWGIRGAGKRSCVEQVARKLRPEHRGEKREIATQSERGETYPVLPIELGKVGGVRTRIDMVVALGGSEHASLRRQLLDRADGVVFVVDARPECVEANIASFEELRKGLEAGARRLEDTPLVMQYNKRDLSDGYAIDEVHRRMQLGDVATIESVASEGTGVLEGLSTISKMVVRALREQSLVLHARESEIEEPASPPAAFSAPLAMERAIRAEAGQPEAGSIDAEVLAAQAFFETAGEAMPLPGEEVSNDPSLHIASVGEVTRKDATTLRLPLVLADEKGTSTRIELSISIEAVILDLQR
ncbi:MAG: GTPase domain-containing protein [Myxococcota bacterium]